jgi:hypothetical protein
MMLTKTTRTTEFVHSKRIGDFTESDVERLWSCASDGFQLRSELTTWHRTAQAWYLDHPPKDDKCLALVYYSALSIYHSGIYDYSLAWSTYAIATPSLDQREIQQHVCTILELTQHSLQSTNLSGLLFLVPLRIAGARATSPEQRSRIIAMLSGITNTFRAASAVSSDLDELWAGPMRLKR